MKSYSRCFPLVAALVVLSFVSLCLTGRASAESEWRFKQEKFWTNSESLFNAIATLAHIRSVSSINGDERISSELTDSMLGLLYLFDADDSDKALDYLAKLSSYYLGEAPGEVYSCIVVRKGNRMLHALEAQLGATQSDDCQARIGKSNSSCLAAFGPVKRRDAVQMLIRQIKADTPCTIER